VLRSKNEWSCISIPQYAFIAWSSVIGISSILMLPNEIYGA